MISEPIAFDGNPQLDFYTASMPGLRERVAEIGADLLVTTDDVLRIGPDGGAIFDPSERYRYVLWRVWDASLPVGAFVGLNPSTADHEKSDPTCTRETRFLKAWGYGGYIKGNVYGYRATNPRDMKAQRDPIGPHNDEYLMRMLSRVRLAVAAWGSNASKWRETRFLAKWAGDERTVGELYCLKLTADKKPGHPLYLRANSKPQLFKRKSDIDQRIGS